MTRSLAPELSQLCLLAVLLAFAIKVPAESINCGNTRAQDEIVATEVSGSTVTFCELFFYLKYNTTDESFVKAIGRPGAIHQAAANILLKKSLAERSEATHELAVSEAEIRWRIHDRQVRARFNEVVDNLVLSKIEGTDFNLVARDYYLANPEEFEQPAGVDVDHILVSADERGYSEALRQAESIVERLKSGANFRDLASALSDDESASRNRGHLGVILPGKTYPTFEAAAFALEEPGEISDPVFSPFGIHIIKLNQKVAATLVPYEDVSSSLVSKIRLDAKAKLKRHLLEDLTGDLRVELRSPETELFDRYQSAFGLN